MIRVNLGLPTSDEFPSENSSKTKTHDEFTCDTASASASLTEVSTYNLGVLLRL